MRPSASSLPRPPPNLSASIAASRRFAALGYAPRLGPNALQRGPLYFAGTPDERLADLHAAFADPGHERRHVHFAAATDRTTCSTASTSKPSPRIPSRSSPTAISPASSSACSTSWPARLSRPHARRRFLSSQTASILPVFAPRLPASPTAVGAAEGLRTPQARRDPQPSAARSMAAASASSSRCSARRGSPPPKARCSFLKTPASSPTRSIA